MSNANVDNAPDQIGQPITLLVHSSIPAAGIVEINGRPVRKGHVNGRTMAYIDSYTHSKTEDWKHLDRAFAIACERNRRQFRGGPKRKTGTRSCR